MLIGDPRSTSSRPDPPSERYPGDREFRDRSGPLYTLLRVSLFQKIVIANLALLAIAVVSLLLLTDMGLAELLTLPNGLVTIAVVVGATAVNALLVREALRPIRSMEEVARRIEAGEDGARVESTLLADRRVANLVRQFNRMLDRQELAQQRQRDRAVRALRLMDAESSRSAAELYDSLAQTLAGVLLRIRMLGRSPVFGDASGEGNPGEATRMLDEVRSEVLEALEEARGIARRMHPPELDELGLASALEALARACLETSGVDVVVRADRPLPRLPSEVQLAFFRIAQEGLRNVVDHADATLATVTVGRVGDEFSMRICDDGRGFDTSTVLMGSTGLGLASIQERAVQAGGRVTIRSDPDGGTCIELLVPFPEEDASVDRPQGNALPRVIKGVAL